MKYFREMLEGRLAAWCRLTYDSESFSLILGIREDAWVEVGKLFAQLRATENDLISPFVSPGSEAWGFGSVLRAMPAQDGWVQWTCGIPADAIKRGRDGWRSLYNVSASLSEAFSVLHYLVEESHREGLPPQMMILDTGCGTGSHGSPINVSVLPPMQAWLKTQDRVRLAATMSRNMLAAANRMHGGGQVAGHDAFSYRARIDDFAMIQVAAGGNCNCLGVCDGWSEAKAGQGYVLSSHNTDSPFNQISLLVAIATLWTEAVA